MQQDIIQTQSKHQRNETWDEECKKIIKDKNEARKKWLQMKTRISCNTYIKQIKQASKICIQKKRNWLSSKIKKKQKKTTAEIKLKKFLKKYGTSNNK
jgi:hypothetical protein